MEHWVDVLLPFSILGGLAYGFSAQFWVQLRWFIGMTIGLIIGVWFSSAIILFSDRALPFPADPQFAHGVIFLLMLALGVTISYLMATSLIHSFQSGRSARGGMFAQLGGTLLGFVNGLLFAALVLVTVHLLLSGTLAPSGTFLHPILTGTDANVSLSARALYSVVRLLYRGLGVLLPPGPPEAFRFIIG